MDPYVTISKLLFRAQALMLIPFFVFFGLALRQKHLERTRTLTKAPRFSDRTKIGFFRSARAFCFGAMLTFGASSMLVTHEYNVYSNSILCEMPPASTTQAMVTAPKVRQTDAHQSPHHRPRRRPLQSLGHHQDRRSRLNEA